VDSELLAALHFLQQRRLILVPTGRTVRIWTSGKRVPGWIRQAISRYRKEILLMIARSESLTCPTPDLHRQYWNYALRRHCCDMCSHLKPQIASVDERTPARRKVA
jgi:hypothetical protein